MKKLIFLFVVALAFIGGREAYADYSFSFTGADNSYDFQGTLITSANGGGPLTPSGGSITGTGAANNGVTYSLVYASGYNSIRPFGGTDLIFDNQLSPGSNPVLTGNGLVFKSSDGLSYLNIWGNGASSYTLFQLGGTYDSTTGKYTEIYGPQINGAVSATATPIPAAAWLFGSGLAGLAGIRRRMPA